MKGKKLWIPFLTLGALGLGLLVLLLVWFNFNVEVEPIAPEPTPPMAGSRTSTSSPSVEPSSSVSPVPPSTGASASPQLDGFANGKTRVGTLRVGNQTNHPLRVVLLPQQSQSSTPQSAEPQASEPSSYSEPVHWDFAPEEGSERGLILSLPDNSLSLRDGDILMAFAQDGSKRYWGPYIVGKTSRPVWNTTNKEWLLLLQP
jgi:hypothetical protein